MKRKTCLVLVANEVLDALLLRLPAHVHLAGRLECFTRTSCVIRLSGVGLPDWCEEPRYGLPYAWAAVIIGTDGHVHFVHGSPPILGTVSHYEYLQAAHSNPN
jgi:hypothetical protein